MSNSNSHQTLISILPDHLIIDNILPRLPVKTLIRSKIVCKLWHSVISSIDFAKSHLKFSSLNPSFVVLTVKDFAHYTLWLLDNNELIRLDFDRNWMFTHIDLVGCGNGLICLYFEFDDDHDRDCFRVWNPVTRKCRTIMNPVTSDGDELNPVYFGFNYASSIDDYIIVAPVLDDDYDRNAVYYFTLRSGIWKTIRGSFLTCCKHSLFYPTEGAQTWKDDNRIVGFDLADEKWKEIPFLDGLTPYHWVDFFSMNECVSLHWGHCSGDHGQEVWVLKRYGDENSWEKMFSLKFQGWVFGNMTETCKCLLTTHRRGKVVDLRQDTPDECGVVFYLPDCFIASKVYVESLISPFFPSSLANQEDKEDI